MGHDTDAVGYPERMGDRDGYHHGNLKEALIEAARALVADSGVQGLSLRAVARRAGVSQAAPYHHFDSKEALVAELCRRGFETLSQRTCAAMEEATTGPERLVAMARAYVAFARDLPDLFGIMWGGKGLIADKAPYVELTDTATGSFEQLLRVVSEGMAAGELRAGDPLEVALAAWSAVHGVAVLAQDGGFDNPKMQDLGVTPERALEAVLRALLAGVA
ncbi:MAG: TetR/AcrR family transcriptional regulator [Myxococcota bacterium]